MKRFYTLVSLLCLLSPVMAQVTTWTGAAQDNSWINPRNWDQGVPTSQLIARFDKGSSLSVQQVPDQSIAGLQVLANTTLTLQKGSAGTLTILNGNGTSAANLSVAEGSAMEIGNHLTLLVDDNALAEIKGTLSIAEGAIFHTAGPGTMTRISGTVRNEGTFINSNPVQLQFQSTSKYNHERNGGTIPTATWDKASTCIVSGITNTAPNGVGQVFGNFHWNCPAQSAAFQPGIAIPNSIEGDLRIQRIGSGYDESVYIQFPVNGVRIGGDFELEQGIVGIVSTTANVDLLGNFIMSGGNLRVSALTRNATLHFNFAGSHVQSFIKTGGGIDRMNAFANAGNINFNVRNGAILDMGQSVLTGFANFSVENGAVLMTAHPQGLSATGNTGSIQVSGTRTFASQAGYVYHGNTQQVTGSGLPNYVKSLVIDNGAGYETNGGVILTHGVSIKEELVLKNGYVQASATAILALSDGSKVSREENSFVAGPMQKTGNTAFKFPTGWAGSSGGYIPIEVNEINEYSTIQAEYRRATATTVGNTINMPLHHVSYCEFWELYAVSGNPTARVSIYWNAHSNCNPVSYISNFPNLRVAHLKNGSVKAWTDAGNTGGNLADGFVMSREGIELGESQGKYFTMASISSANSSLPVFFDGVIAYEDKGDVEIKWSNLTERDIATYFVERSVNGRDYAVIGQHLPKSNRDDKASYEQRDNEPVKGSNYYRIKVIERTTSKIIFSKVIRVDLEDHRQLNLYPNPVEGNRLSLSLSGVKPGMYRWRVMTTSGQVLIEKQFQVLGTGLTQELNLPANVLPGMYRILVSGDAYEEHKLFLVR